MSSAESNQTIDPAHDSEDSALLRRLYRPLQPRLPVRVGRLKDEDRTRDAAWYMDKLEQRLFNRDSEGMLVERLGKEEVHWAASAFHHPPQCLAVVKDVMDSWLDEEFVLPTGSYQHPFSPDDLSPAGCTDAHRELERLTQVIQLRNSFGVGVFVGGLLSVIAELASEVGVEIEVSLKPALSVLGTSPLRPEDLEDSGDTPWAERLQTHLSELLRRVPLMPTLRPIVRRHGFLRGRYVLLSPRRLQNAQRSMFLAGLMAAGLDPLPLMEEVGTRPCQRRGLKRPQAPRRESEASQDLFHRTDKELEGLLGDESLREDLVEELEFRLRNNRLSRMLAHLKRTSRAEREHEEATDDE